MLPQINRLRNTKDIEMVFKKGRGVKEGFLFLKFLENNLKVSRFAFIVSRKTARKAVQRNKIKRRLRDIVQKNLPRLKTGFDFVFVAQKGIEDKSLQEMKDNIERILSARRILGFPISPKIKGDIGNQQIRRP